MANPGRSETVYDAIVIGTGQGGSPLSRKLAAAGKKTAVIERAQVGGTCVNVGCTPTKTMVASARIAYLARRAADYGVHAGAITVNQSEVRRRKQGVVETFRDGDRKRLESSPHLELLFGHASFDGPRSVLVKLNEGGERRLTAPWIFVNVGCRPASPVIAGSDRIRVLDSTSIMELEETPEHLLVLGGGYIGLEFGQMFRRFGSRVTIVQRGSQLLTQEDPDVAAEIKTILEEDGVTVLLDSHALEVSEDDGRMRLTIKTPVGTRTIGGSHLLAAAGRVPNTEGLGLDLARIATDAKGFIVANDRLETSAPGIFAMGDVKGGPAFTHISYDDHRILAKNLLDGGGASTAGRFVPYTVFIDPQLGRVGLNETQARAQNRPVRIAKLPMTRVARAIELGETRGFMKAVVDAADGAILGYVALGVEGGELMSMMEIAMMGKVPYTALRDATFAHPCLSESFNNLFAKLE
jgi:pyruvate/2-oxoglutarate dehydrogenase complex dihydrolipoamide dehydrogenase (E3) component